MISLFEADNRINVTQNLLFTINELERSGSSSDSRLFTIDPIFITIERKSAKKVSFNKFMAIRERKVVFNQSVLVGRAVDNYDRTISDKVFFWQGHFCKVSLIKLPLKPKIVTSRNICCG